MNRSVTTVILATILVLAVSSLCLAKTRYTIGGGPAGGTFEVVANAIQFYEPIRNCQDFSLRAQSSDGSLENLRNVNSGKVAFATVYAGQVYNGRKGKLKEDPTRYKKVLALGYLYGAPAQLVVRKGSGISGVKDLLGKKVGVGNAGSGAYANCELFFSWLGVWDKIKHESMGYNDAAQAFGNEEIDAFWLFTALPSGAVVMATQINDIDLVNLNKAASVSGYYEHYPYFSETTIPAGTYRGVDHPTPSFQDSALLVAGKDVPAKDVYRLLSIIYSPKGLEYMREQKAAFKEMSVENGLKGINPKYIPLHPGAVKFWKEKGVLK